MLPTLTEPDAHRSLGTDCFETFRAAEVHRTAFYVMDVSTNRSLNTSRLRANSPAMAGCQFF